MNTSSSLNLEKEADSPSSPRSVDPTELATQYANLLAMAINFCDIELFQQHIIKFCVPMVKVIRRISTNVPPPFSLPYPIQHPSYRRSTTPVSPSRGVPVTYSEHYGIPSFCELLRDFYRLVPDGVMEVYNHRCCHQSQEFTVFISSYRYTGTLFVSPYVNPASVSFGPTVDYPLQQLYRQGQSRPLTIVGSILIYVLPSSHVYCVEFLSEYV